MAGIHHEPSVPLDGTDASEIIFGRSDKRSRAMGLWHGFQNGQSTWSDRIQKAIMEKQQAGAPQPHNAERMQKDVDEYPQFAEDTTTGHAAWTDWPWKLHRINGEKYELYNLAEDPMEASDLSNELAVQERLASMKTQLADWMVSVVRSLNGLDYEVNLK